MTEDYARNVHDIIPILTDYSRGDFVVSASSHRTSTIPPYYAWRAWLAFNGSVNTTYDSWVATSESCWLKVYIGYFFGDYHDVLSYTISAGPEGSGLDSLPRNWTLQGSNDDINWTIIDIRTNELNWGYKEIREYTIASPGDYVWYKLVVTNNNYSFYGTYIGEFNLRGRSVFLSPDSANISTIPNTGPIGTRIGSQVPDGVYATLKAVIDGNIIDKKIAISSFSMRKEVGQTKYISVVVPSLSDAGVIADMSGGSLYIWAMQRGVLTEIGDLPMTSIRLDEGGKNQAITLQASA